MGWLPFLFWSNIGLAAVCIVLAGANWWLARRWWFAALAGGCALLGATSAVNTWRLFGRCLLPYAAVVPYEDGMTLCPGQAADVVIELAPPPAGRGL